MKRTPWILGSMTAILLAACGGGRQNTPGTPETGAAGAPADTTGMAPAPAPSDTSAGAAGMSDTSMKPTGTDTGWKSDTTKQGKHKKQGTGYDTTKSGTTTDSAK
jgi:hypothetical protein